jgi:hypothetical protein
LIVILPILYGNWVRKNNLGLAGDIVSGDVALFGIHGPVRLVACSRVPVLQLTCRFEPDFWMVGDGGATNRRMTTALT